MFHVKHFLYPYLGEVYFLSRKHSWKNKWLIVRRDQKRMIKYKVN